MVQDARALGAALEQVLTNATGAPIRLEHGPEPLTGGNSAQLFSLRTEDPPDERWRELVLRIPARGDGVRREGLIQRVVAGAGYPAPPVLVLDDEPANPIGSPFIIMARAAGAPSFVDSGPIETISAFRRVPRVLGRLMADLHDLDPEPAVRALEGGGISADHLGASAMLGEVERAGEAGGAPGLRSIAAWLAANTPAVPTRVVCHGDLHALNVLEDAGRFSVIDWELATIGHPALDVARTSLLLSAVPIEMPARIRSFVQRLGRRSAARFRRAYAERRPLDPHALVWHEALHAARILSRLRARAAQTDPPVDPVLEAWAPAAPFLTTQLRRITGIDVR